MKESNKFNSDNIQFGFVILFPVFNTKKIQDTLKSLKTYYNDYPYVISCGKQLDKDQIKWTQALCGTNPIVQSGESILCLVNDGIKSSHTQWNFVLIAGTRVKTKIDRLYRTFLKSNKDVLYAVLNKKINFFDSTMNGMFVNKDALVELGDISCSDNEDGYNKIIWMNTGVELGYTFKGIVGVPLVGG